MLKVLKYILRGQIYFLKMSKNDFESLFFETFFMEIEWNFAFLYNGD